MAVPEFVSLQELKGNIRVFCRVRPLLPYESGAVSYPKSGENLGRGIELLHNGKSHVYIHFCSFRRRYSVFRILIVTIAFLIISAQGYSFTFDKVFDHSASQEHVFIEISQLVQSALDGYKVQYLDAYN